MLFSITSLAQIQFIEHITKKSDSLYHFKFVINASQKKNSLSTLNYVTDINSKIKVLEDSLSQISERLDFLSNTSVNFNEEEYILKIEFEVTSLDRLNQWLKTTFDNLNSRIAFSNYYTARSDLAKHWPKIQLSSSDSSFCAKHKVDLENLEYKLILSYPKVIEYCNYNQATFSKNKKSIMLTFEVYNFLVNPPKRPLIIK